MSQLQKDFDEQGFVKVEQLFSVPEALSFKTDIRRVLEAERARPVGAGRTPESVLRDGVFVGLAAHRSVFRAAARDPHLLDVLEQILGPNIEFLSDKIVFKTAATNYGSP